VYSGWIWAAKAALHHRVVEPATFMDGACFGPWKELKNQCAEYLWLVVANSHTLSVLCFSFVLFRLFCFFACMGCAHSVYSGDSLGWVCASALAGVVVRGSSALSCWLVVLALWARVRRVRRG